MLTLQEKELVWKRLGYKPNPIQRQLHALTNRVVLVAGGERAGKSRVGSIEVSANSLDGRLFWIVGPDYYQARAEFNYVVNDLGKLDAIYSLSQPKEGSCSMILHGGIEIVTRTGEDDVKLASFPPDGILMVEAAQQSFQNFEKLANRTAEKRGWLWLTGTFESSLGWYAELFNLFQGPNPWGGVSLSLPTWSNLAVFPGGENDPEILRLKATNPSDRFLERFGGIPCPPAGLVFREFRHMKHVVPIMFGDVKTVTQGEGYIVLPEDTEVEVAVDPGWAGAYAVLFVATVGGRVFVLDEIYAKAMSAESVILEARNSKRELWDRVKRTQSKHGSAGVIDIAGRQHQGMESHEEIWQAVGGVLLRSTGVGILDGILRHHTFLLDPFVQAPRLLHDPKCLGTIKEYGLYRYKEDSERRAESELPIDRDNHSMKALAYYLVDKFGFVDQARPRAQKPIQTEVSKEIDAAWKARERGKEPSGWLA